MGGWQVADDQRLTVGYSRFIDKCKARKYLVTSDCVNTIACYKLLTGKDGQKGAAKDMIDCDRYAVMSDIWDMKNCEIVEIPNTHFPLGNSTISALRNSTAERRSKIVNW